MSELRVAIQRLPHGQGLPLPAYQTAQAAGMDLYAALPDDAPCALAPGERAAIPAGFALALPDGYEAQVRPRSGLARNHGIALVNAPGTIDADYRGEVQVLLINLGAERFVVRRGDRIGQLVVAPVLRVRWEEVEALETSERGAGGFGHTGRQG